jgi:hypothetical protein
MWCGLYLAVPYRNLAKDRRNTQELLYYRGALIYNSPSLTKTAAKITWLINEPVWVDLWPLTEEKLAAQGLIQEHYKRDI